MCPEPKRERRDTSFARHGRTRRTPRTDLARCGPLPPHEIVCHEYMGIREQGRQNVHGAQEWLPAAKAGFEGSRLY